MSSIEEVRTVVIAMDGSEYAQDAFDWYWAHIHRDSDAIILVHVPEFYTVTQSPLEIANFTALTNLYTEEEEATNAYEQKLTSMLRDKSAKGKVVITRGQPGEVILNVAGDEGADFIITGSRGMGTIRRTLLGSVSDYIMHHSNVPVIVCKH